MIDPISSPTPNSLQNASGKLPKLTTSHCFPDSIVTQSFSSAIGSGWKTVVRGFNRCIQFLKSIFCCCFTRRSSASESLKVLKGVQENFPKKVRQFNEGALSRPALQKWWGRHYQKLTPQVQRLLLLEDIKLRSPDGQSPDQWAEENFNHFRGTAEDFVVNLYVQGREKIDPILDLPRYIENVVRQLENQD